MQPVCEAHTIGTDIRANPRDTCSNLQYMKPPYMCLTDARRQEDVMLRLQQSPTLAQHRCTLSALEVSTHAFSMED